MKVRNLNPFPTTKYLGPHYFCDRKDESEQLIRNISGQQSTTLVSIRRMGKTGLIKHVFHKLSKKYITIYVDILSTENLETFLNTLSSSVLASVSQRSNIGQKIWSFFKSLNVSISFDQLNGSPSVSFNLKEDESKVQIKSIFDLLDQQNKPVVIAIDEFQQITRYPEKNVDAFLRTVIQQLKNVVFIFSGSQQQIITELFANPAKPFFRSTSFIHLSEIQLKTYQDFIIRKFKTGKKTIKHDTAEEILKWTRQHTYYVQLLCNRIYNLTNDRIDSKVWKSEADRLLKEQNLMFFTYRIFVNKNHGTNSNYSNSAFFQSSSFQIT
jgi:AAA+ ATPase superfamily predicted ATPase